MLVHRPYAIFNKGVPDKYVILMATLQVFAAVFKYTDTKYKELEFLVPLYETLHDIIEREAPRIYKTRDDARAARVLTCLGMANTLVMMHGKQIAEAITSAAGIESEN